MHTASRTFPGVPASVSTARRFAADLLSEWAADEAEWTVTQLVSELATNAVLHARSAFEVELQLDGEQLLIRVSDQSPQEPVRRRFGEQSTTGRGLALLAQLSEDWGVDLSSDGKTVWCAVPASGAVAGELFDLTMLLEESDDDMEPAADSPDGDEPAAPRAAVA